MFKKYKIIGGKRYGPYLYESKRVGDKVLTNYIGKCEEKTNKLYLVYVLIGIVLVFGAAWFVYNNISPTGKVTMNLKSEYAEGEKISGSVKFSLQQGELVPVDSKLIVKIGSEQKEFLLSQLINSEMISGDFYAEGVDLSGSGAGYGIEGSRVSYPELDFSLNVYSSVSELDGGGEEDGNGVPVEAPIDIPTESPEETSGEQSSGIPVELPGESPAETSGEQPSDISVELPIEVPVDTVEETNAGARDENPSEPVEQGSESPISENSPITGAVISESNSEKIVDGKVSKDSDFLYDLQEGENAEIVSGSVKDSGSVLDDSVLNLQVSNNEVKVSTSYSVEEGGFGKDFSGDDEVDFSVDLSNFDLSAVGDKIIVRLVYGEVEIFSIEEDVVVNAVPEVENETGQEIPIIELLNISENITLELNETEIVNITDINVSEANVSVILLKNIPMIRLTQNSSVELNLSDYFSGAESYEFIGQNIIGVLDDYVLAIRAGEGFKGSTKGRVTAYSGNESLESNEFNILVSSGAVSIQTLRNKIVVNERVKWTKNISLEFPENLTVELPKEAENISVKKIESGNEVGVDSGHVGITGRAIISNREVKESWFSGLISWFSRSMSRITGRAVSDVVDSANLSDVGLPVQVTLAENSTNYLVEYYTDAPTVYEEMISGGKRVTVSGPDELNYTDVLAYTNLSNKISVSEQEKIKVYWKNYDYKKNIEIKKVYDIENVTLINEDIIGVEENVSMLGSSETNISINNRTILENISSNFSDILLNETLPNQSNSLLTGSVIAELNISGDLQIIDENVSENISSSLPVGNGYVFEEIPFDAYDLDGDGKLDYIEWIAPHLSEQEFQIIEITKAEHLDSNRTFIEDVYEQVKALDDVYANVPAKDYVRVVFERNLTNENDITIYAKANSSAAIEVYEKDGNVSIAKFENVFDYGKYRVLLTSLENSEDTFDLRVINADIEFDYIVDPASSYNISFVFPTPSNGSSIANASIGINVSIANAPDLGQVKYNWNGINYSVYDDSLIAIYNLNNLSLLGENATYFADLSKYSNNLTCTNCPTFNSSGKYGGAYQFDGTNDIISKSSFNYSSFSNQITMSAWVKRGSMPTGTPSIISAFLSNTGFSLYNFGDYRSLVKDSGAYGTCFKFVTSSYASDEDKWVHFASVYNGDNLTLYVNGVNIGVDDCDGGNIQFTAGVSLNLGFFSSGYYNGTIDDVTVLNRSLSEQEINQIYMSNLWKYNSTQWYLYVNQSKNATAKLDDGSYTYQVFAADTSNNWNSTEQRTITIDSIFPQINFTFPTPASGSTQSTTNIYVNVSSNDSNPHYVINDFDKSLFSWWRLEQGNGTFFVDENGKYNMTCSNCPAFNPAGKWNGGYTFDGVNDLISKADFSYSSFSNQITMSAWVRRGNMPTGTPSIISAFASNTGFMLYYFADYRSLVKDSGAYGTCFKYVTSSYASDEDKWVHFASVYNGDNLTLYVNGVDIGTDDCTGGNIEFTAGVDLNLGFMSSGFYNGTIDDAMIFNRSLSASEILALYNATANKYYNDFTNLGAGAHTFKAYAVDSAGNKNSTEQRTVTIESTQLVGCSNLTVSNTVYTLQNNVVQAADDNCFTITADNVTLDGKGYKITCMAGYQGVVAQGRRNMTLINMTVTDCTYGINFTGVNNSLIKNVNSSLNTEGIYLAGSSFNLINNTITNNNNNGGFGGISLMSNSNNNNLSNIVSNSNGDAGGLYISNSYNNYISTINVSGGGNGAVLESGSTNNIFSNISFNSVVNGISLSSSFNNQFISGNINGSSLDAVSITGASSTNNSFTNVTITKTAGAYRDIKFATASINGTQLIDMPHIGNYSFTGVGGTVIVRNSQWGEVRFLTPVNGSGTNFTADVMLKDNSVYVNSAQTGLNKSANVTLYGTPGAGFSFPAIYKDGTTTCSATTNPSCSNLTSLSASTVVFNVSSWSNYSIGGNYNITQCGTLGEANKVYTLMNDIDNYGGTCFTITADNITLNGNGKTIDGDGVTLGFGILSDSSQSNVTIKNVTITDFLNRGIYFIFSNSLLKDVTVRRSGSNGIEGSGTNNIFIYVTSEYNALAGISASGSFFNVTSSHNLGNGFSIGGTYNLYQNLTAINNSGSGVHIGGSYNNVSTVLSNSNNYGLYIYCGSINITVNNLIGNNNNNGVYIQSSCAYYHLLNNSLINGSKRYALWLEDEVDGLSNVINNVSIINTNFSSYDLYINTDMTGDLQGPSLINMPHVRNYSIVGSGAAVKIKNSQWGEVRFLNPINGSGNNFTADIMLKNNSAFVNSSKSGLNKSANVTLYGTPGAGFSFPTIYKDGTTICSSTTNPSCSNLTSLSASTVVFNVSSWSNYSIGGNYNITQCGTLGEANKVYTLMDDIWAYSGNECFAITALNVTLNGQGYSIFDGGGVISGIRVAYNARYALINNLTIDGFTYGIRLDSATDNYHVIKDTEAVNSGSWGIQIISTDNTFINFKGSIRAEGGDVFNNRIIYNNSFGIINIFKPDADWQVSGLTFPGNVKIENNSAYLNSTALPALNVSSNVTLYGLSTTYPNPRILRDGAICPTGVCYNFTSLNAGTVVFNVSYWSNYSIGYFYPQYSNLVTSPTSPVTYAAPTVLYKFNSTWTDGGGMSKVILTFNGTNYTASNLSSVYNVTLLNFAVGSYNYLWWANNTQGNSNQTPQYTYTVNQAAAQTSLTFSVASPQTYGTAVTPTCSVITGVGTPVLTVNGTTISSGSPITLGAGTWTFNCSLASSQNYTAASNSSLYTINQATPTLTFLANGGTSNLTLTYPQQVNISARASAGTVGLDKDGVNYLSNNGLNVTLGVASYIFRANISGNQNYTNVGYSYYNITITQSGSAVYTYINNNRGNINIAIGNSLWLNGSLITGQFGSLNLTLNGVQLNYSTTSNLSNYYTFNSVGIFTINTSYSGNQNYTGSSESWIVNASNLIFQCENLSVANTVYTLQNNATATANCFNITADNVTLNGNGYTINGDSVSADAVFAGGRKNITIRNLKVYFINDGAGIEFNNVNNSFIINSTISVPLRAFIASNINYNIIENNSLISNDCGGFNAVDLTSSGFNNLTNNTINSCTGTGVYISSSTNNIFNKNTFGDSNAINFNLIGNSFDNVLNNNTLIGSGTDLVFSTASINGTQLIDMPRIASYSFTGVGGKVIVRNSQWGEVRFLSPINGSGTNFTADIMLKNNSAYVNSSKIGLNKSANVTLYGLSTTFANPKIMRDGALCAAGVCYNFTSLNAGTVVFNVTGWSNYSIAHVNRVPNTPVLSSPTHGSSTTNRAPQFNWTGSDPDSDTLQYELNITCYTTSWGACSGKGNDNRYYNITYVGTNTAYNITGDLQYLYDNQYIYNWTARAYDGALFGNWSQSFILNVSSLIDIKLNISVINFSSLGLNGQDNTTDNSPQPFVIQNDGNSFVHVNISATDLFSTASNPSSNYQFKIGNNTVYTPNENGSFNWSGSTTVFTNMPNSITRLFAISYLNYSNATDSARVDVLVQVPASEPPGSRNSTVTFYAVLGE